MKEFLLNNLFNILLFFVGFTGLVVYWMQEKNRKKEAAALIVTQIEDLKDKLIILNNIIIDNKINEKLFYETLDLINDNQWDKYKHLFIRKIDTYSFRTIGKFYEYASSIREQLQFVKRLQYNQYFNIQGMLDNNCNDFLRESLKLSIDVHYLEEYKKAIENIETSNENEEYQKKLISGMIKELINATPNFQADQFWKIYNNNRDLLKNIVNLEPYISYTPCQVLETLGKALKNINSIEIIGCEGYKKLKTIAKIK